MNNMQITNKRKAEKEQRWLSYELNSILTGNSSYEFSFEGSEPDSPIYLENDKEPNLLNSRNYKLTHCGKSESFKIPSSICKRMNFDRNNATSEHTTKAISLPTSHILRTESELQLSENLANADWRDNCMFHRIVNGLQDQQARNFNYRAKVHSIDNIVRSNEKYIGNIVRRHYEDLHNSNSLEDSLSNLVPDFGSDTSSFIDTDEENEIFAIDI